MLLTLIYTELLHKNLVDLFFFFIVLFSILCMLGIAFIVEVPNPESILSEIHYVFFFISLSVPATPEVFEEEAENVVSDSDASSKVALLDAETPSPLGSIQESDEKLENEIVELQPQYEITGWELFKEPNFYLLFFTMVFVTGTILLFESLLIGS